MGVIPNIYQKKGWLFKMASINQSEIQEILKKFREKTHVLCSSLFNDDGFLITLEQANTNDCDDFHESIGAICANIIALAAQGIDIVHGEKSVKKISIKADELRNEGFEIIIESITEDVLLSIIFASSLNLGFILLELRTLIQTLKRYFLELDNDEIVELAQAEL